MSIPTPDACWWRGATWGDVDHATQPFGLAVPAGIISTTGVGGLTLGGGFGYLSRKHGLTLDNLLTADMVLADGSFVTVSATERPDLFWAIRGGGGNFGVVTAFEFQAHEVGNVFAGVLFYEVEKSKQLMELYRDFIETAPRELGLFFGTIFTPEAPFLPVEHHNKQMGKIVFCFNGPEAEGRAIIEPFLAVGPSAEFAGEFPFATWNSAFDAMFPAGRQDYWKADYITELTDEMIEIHLEHGHKMPNAASIMHIYSLNGAIQDVARTETAYSHRDAKFVHVILMTDDDADRMQENIAFARMYWDALHPLSSGGGYVNMMMDEGSRPGESGLPRELSAVAADQGDLRSQQPLQRESEHHAEALIVDSTSERTGTGATASVPVISATSYRPLMLSLTGCSGRARLSLRGIPPLKRWATTPWLWQPWFSSETGVWSTRDPSLRLRMTGVRPHR
ncbi:MAG: FAD-binding protein [Thermomicrobiales bacterium]